MRPVALIAGNLVREQRWIVLVVMLLALALAAVESWPGEIIVLDQIQFYLGYVAAYALGFAIFVAAQSIYSERKNRRILNVLSKGIERRQYIAGLLLGVFASTALLMIAAGLGASFMALRVSAPVLLQWKAVALIWIASCLSAAVVIFWATFLHPLFALIVASGVIGIGPLLAYSIGPGARDVVPVYALVEKATELAIGHPAGGIAIHIFISCAEGIIFWLLAGWVFEKRDVAVAIE